ncbi:DUF494 family protein [Chitiniphilus shinanonensis]
MVFVLAGLRKPMLDVLAYLFQVFYHADGMPDVPKLASELADAGFEDDEIGEALAWLDDLGKVDLEPYAALAGRYLARQLHPDEADLLSPDALGYWYGLTQADALDAAECELVLDRVREAAPVGTGLERLQRLVLLAIWHKRHEHAALLIEDILFGRENATLH